MNDYNKVKLTGRIIHIYEISKNPARCILTLSAQGECPKVFATDKIGYFAITKCRVGDWVSIDANIQSSVKAKVGVCTTVFADHITKHKTEQKQENIFYIYGEIKSVRTWPDKKISRIIVKTTVNGRVSTIPITFYNPDQRLFAISDNPYLSIKGKIQTTKKVYQNGKVKMFYQNYVADFPRQE